MITFYILKKKTIIRFVTDPVLNMDKIFNLIHVKNINIDKVYKNTLNTLDAYICNEYRNIKQASVDFSILYIIISTIYTGIFV